MNAPTGSDRKTISAILLDAGVVSDDQIQAALRLQSETGRRIGESLVELGFASEEDIGWSLARQLGVAFVDVTAESLDDGLLRMFPEPVMRRLLVVPLMRNDGVLTLATSDPTDHDAIREIERLSRAVHRFVVATPTAIVRALDARFGPTSSLRTRWTADGSHVDVPHDTSGDRFLQLHLTGARRAGATEVHFVLREGRLNVYYRVGTHFVPAAQESAPAMAVLLTRLEAEGMQPDAAHESHQTGSMTCDMDGHEQTVHVSLLVGRGGPSVTVRLLRDPAERSSLDQLGLDPGDIARLRGIMTDPCGLVLVCGPTGSGCSTTLATLLAEMPTDERRWMVFARDQRRWPDVRGLVDIVTGPPVRHWRRVAVAHGADGLVLDGGLAGRRARAVIGSATHARWVLARTDWEDTFVLLEWLSRIPEGRLLLSRRLRAVIQQRLVAGASGSGGTQSRAVFEVLFAGDTFREALLRGADAVTLRTLAEREGFRSLAEVIRARVESGELDADDAERAVA